MSDLRATGAVGWFKREVAVPGTYDRLFPESTDDLVAASLVDGLYRAKIDGFFPAVDADLDTFQTTPDLSQTGLGLVVIYAGIRFLQNQIKDMATRQTYRAPGVESTTEHSPGVLTERLKELNEERKQLVLQARQSRGGTPVYMQDGYMIRVTALYGYEFPVYVGNTPAELTRY